LGEKHSRICRVWTEERGGTVCTGKPRVVPWKKKWDEQGLKKRKEKEARELERKSGFGVRCVADSMTPFIGMDLRPKVYIGLTERSLLIGSAHGISTVHIYVGTVP
jgi:hypothetical protein